MTKTYFCKVSWRKDGESIVREHANYQIDIDLHKLANSYACIEQTVEETACGRWSESKRDFTVDFMIACE